MEVGVLAGEARVVLAPWLAPLEAGRPWITWPYLICSGRIMALPWTAPGAEALRAGADAVLDEDGQVTEAVPGSHGHGMLSLTSPPPAVMQLTGRRCFTGAGSAA